MNGGKLNKDSPAGCVGIVILVIVAVLLAVFVWPSSTNGVERIGDREARISEDDTLVLIQPLGKTTYIWKITYDGNDTVIFKNTTLFGIEYERELCGIDCRQSVTIGLFSSFGITERPDGEVDIEWPFGFIYRS